MSKALEKAEKLFEEFHGRAPRRGEVGHISCDDLCFNVGEIVSVAYKTDIDGKTETYYHDFSEHRPVLFCNHDGKQLYIVAGQYRFTKLGIKG